MAQLAEYPSVIEKKVGRNNPHYRSERDRRPVPLAPTVTEAEKPSLSLWRRIMSRLGSTTKLEWICTHGQADANECLDCWSERGV